MLITVATHSQVLLQDRQPGANQIQGLEETTQETINTLMRETVRNLAEEAGSRKIDSFSNASENLSETGSHNTLNQGFSLEDFSETTRSLSGGFTEVNVNISSVATENFSVKVNSVTSVGFETLSQRQNTSTEFQINNVSDRLLSRYGYSSTISRCNYTKFAKKIGSGSNVSGTARGTPKAKTPPLSLTDNSKEVLVTTNVTEYSDVKVETFAGYITNSTPNNPNNYNQNYVTGLSSIPSLNPKQRIIIHDDTDSSNSGAWKSNINRTISSGCYIPTSMKSAPSIGDRIENKSRGATEEGVLTVINASKFGTNFSESNIGFERVNKPSQLVNISGVSNGDGINKSYFRMNKSTAQSVGLQSLIQ